jgi:hypothetical protein
MSTVEAATLIQTVSLSPDPPKYFRAIVHSRAIAITKDVQTRFGVDVNEDVLREEACGEPNAAVLRENRLIEV